MVTYDRRDAGKLLVPSDRSRLDKELIAALGIGRRFLLHSLEEHYSKVSDPRMCKAVLFSQVVPETSKDWPGSIRPALGRTQYL